MVAGTSGRGNLKGSLCSLPSKAKQSKADTSGSIVEHSMVQASGVAMSPRDLVIVLPREHGAKACKLRTPNNDLSFAYTIGSWLYGNRAFESVTTT